MIPTPILYEKISESVAKILIFDLSLPNFKSVMNIYKLVKTNNC